MGRSSSLFALVLCLVPALAAAQANEPRMRVAIDGAPARGAAEPLVTIVEFSDFQCPFCSRVQPTLQELLNRHPGELRIAFRHNPLPFHQDAMPAAELATEAQVQRGDAGFWLAHERLFADQRNLSRADLLRTAAQIGLDPRRTGQALDDGRHRPRIEAEMRRASEIGATGTPTFFINGRRLVGAQPVDAFDRIVVEEIAAARAMLSRGVPRPGLYDRLMASATDRFVEPSRPDSPAPRLDPPDVITRVPVDGSPQQGPDDALVTMVVFSEFQCPFCGRLRPTLAALRDRYGADLRLVWKHQPLPFHTNALPAARLANEAFALGGSALFWRLHDVLFDHQAQLGRDELIAHAQSVGMDARRAAAAIEGGPAGAAVERDLALAAELGVRGTPISFINGRKLSGAQPLETFVAVIDEEIATARARVRRGTPRARLYETLPVGMPAPALPGAARPSQRPVPSPEEPRFVRLAPDRRAPARGPRRARVTVQVFGDFQCPFTARMRPILLELANRFPTQVRIVWRNHPLPFHPHAHLAAQAAFEAQRQGGDERFWQLFERLFDRQRELSPEVVQEAARETGMDVAALEAALASGRHRARVDADERALERAAGAQGTPITILEGRVIAGAQPLDVFVRAVEEALARRPGRRPR